MVIHVGVGSEHDLDLTRLHSYMRYVYNQLCVNMYIHVH